MSLNLDRLQARDKYWEDGKPTLQMQLFWQKFAKAIEDAFNTNEELDATQQQLIEDVQTALTAALGASADLGTTNDFIRTRDSAVDSLTIDADTSSITVSTHDRQYLDPSQTVSVTGDTITGLSSSTTYYIHYTDPDYAGGSVGYQVATALADAVPSPTEPYRHYVGTVEVPAAGTASGTAAPDPYWKVTSVGGGGGSGDLLSTNNLSDVANASTALTNLGLSANGKSLVTAADYPAMKALLDLEIGTDVQAYNALLAAIVGLGSNGLVARTAAGTAAARTITAGTGISVTNGDGSAGNPTVSTSFVGVRVKRTTNQTTANYTTQTAIPFEAEVIDTDGAWDVGTPGKIVVPAAWNGKYANAQAGVQITSVTADVFVRLFVRHQNSSGVTLYAAGNVSEYTTTNNFVSAALIAIPLTTGDVIEAMLTVETDNSVTVESSLTELALHVIG